MIHEILRIHTDRGGLPVSDLLDAAEGGVAFLCGGFIVLFIARASETAMAGNLNLWGIFFVLIGLLVLLTAVAATFGTILSEVVQ